MIIKFLQRKNTFTYPIQNDQNCIYDTRWVLSRIHCLKLYLEKYIADDNDDYMWMSVGEDDDANDDAGSGGNDGGGIIVSVFKQFHNFGSLKYWMVR